MLKFVLAGMCLYFSLYDFLVLILTLLLSFYKWMLSFDSISSSINLLFGLIFKSSFFEKDFYLLAASIGSVYKIFFVWAIFRTRFAFFFSIKAFLKLYSALGLLKAYCIWLSFCLMIFYSASSSILSKSGSLLSLKKGFVSWLGFLKGLLSKSCLLTLAGSEFLCYLMFSSLLFILIG